MVFLKGNALSPTARQAAMFFLAIFGVSILYYGTSSAVLQGTFSASTQFRLGGSVAAGVVIYLVLYYFAPKPDYKAVSIYLQYHKQPLTRDFELTAFLPGLNPIQERGHNGTVILQLMTGTQAINNFAVTCKGYRLKDVGPFPITDAGIQLAMVEDTSVAPLGPEQFPSEQAIPELPSEQKVAAKPAYKPEDVTFRYKNMTDTNMRLLVFSCSKYYRKENGPFAAKSPWSDWNFPAKNEFQVLNRFDAGTGWFCFFVFREQPAPGERTLFYLGCKNLFETRTPILVVEDTGNKENPYAARFTSED